MDEVMIRLWNGRVQPDDDVWFLGDFCHKSGKTPEWYLRRLAGRKHLILGNHDQPLYENDTALAYFESVDQIARVNDTYKGENITAVLCHYPIPFFGKNHMRDAGGKLKTFMVHGHVHDTAEAALLYRFEEMSRREKITTAAGDVESMECNLINCFCGYSDYQPLK